MKVLCTLVLLNSFVLPSVSAVAAEKKAEVKAEAKAESVSDERVSAKAIMSGVYQSFLKIVPYVYSDQESQYGQLFKGDSAKKDELLKNLNDLSEFFKSAEHVSYFKRPGFRPSLDTINNHLSDTIVSVKENNYNFAQKRLKAMTSLCISCHSQLSEASSKNSFGKEVNLTDRSGFESDYAFANYLFLVRKFEEAESYFKKAVEVSLEKSQMTVLLDSLRKLLSIYTKVDFDYKKASAFVSAYKDDKRMPVIAKNSLLEWSRSLQTFEKFNAKTNSSPKEFIEKYLAPLEQTKLGQTETNHDVRFLVGSGVLTKFATSNPKSKLMPEILYWLAVADKNLSHSYFFSLSDLYLKDCVTTYSKSPFARKCYELYEENVQFGYSGSGGTDIPEGEKRELQRLKSFLK
jgi:hypothetical protein